MKSNHSRIRKPPILSSTPTPDYTVTLNSAEKVTRVADTTFSETMTDQSTMPYIYLYYRHAQPYFIYAMYFMEWDWKPCSIEIGTSLTYSDDISGSQSFTNPRDSLTP